MARGVVSNALTRYSWVWVLGAMIGAAAGAGWLAATSAGEYPAKVPFEVLAPAAPLRGADGGGVGVMTAEEVRTLINKQKFIFEQETFLEKVLALDEFHPAGHETPWLLQHKVRTTEALKRDLRVVPRVSAGTFEIRFTSHDAAEAQRLVQGAVKEYMEQLRNESKVRSTAYLKGLLEGLKQAEADYQRQSESLMDYSKQMQIDVMKAGFEIQVAALKSLNDDFTHADAAAAEAKGQLDTFTTRRDRLRASGTEVQPGPKAVDLTTRAAAMNDEEIADRLLSLEMKQYLENDATLRTLVNTRMQWEQELASEKAKANGAESRVREITGRLQTIEEQLTRTRDKLKVEALQRMEKTLADEAGSKRGLADYIGSIRSAKERVVNDYGQRLLAWDQKLADVRAQQEFLNSMISQVKMAQANAFLDDTRVRQMVDVPAVPLDTDWPEGEEWAANGGMGAARGLVAGGMLALLLGWARVRRERGATMAAVAEKGTNGFPTV